MDFGRVLGSLAGFFEREGFPYAVIGAFGLHAYGLSRATFDLDVATGSEAQASLVTFLESLGYETLHVSAGYSNHLHPEGALGRVDVVYVGGETSRALFAGCRRALDLGRQTFPVPRPEHLAALKVHAMKNDPTRTLQEMADIRFLLALPGIDEPEVRATSSEAASWTDTMRSSDSADALFLDRDLPTTPNDVLALRRRRERPRADLAAYLRFLDGFGPLPPARLRSRRGPGGPPFELPAPNLQE